MTRVAVIGGTGFAGRHIVAEAAERGHTVVSVSRHLPAQRHPAVLSVAGTLADPPSIAAELDGVDVVVVAVAPRGETAGLVRPGVAGLVAALPPDVRVGVIGGAGGSLVAPDGPRLIDGDFPDEFRAEALEMIGVLEDLQSRPDDRDWFFVHPAAGFGAFRPGERTGHYRTGGDLLVADAAGESFISGADLAIAVVDEIDEPAHRRARFTVGY